VRVPNPATFQTDFTDLLKDVFFGRPLCIFTIHALSENFLPLTLSCHHISILN
jgi:hypothetical protein